MCVVNLGLYVISMFVMTEFGVGKNLGLLHLVNLPIFAVWGLYLLSKGNQIENGRMTGSTNCLIWTFCFITMVMSVFNVIASWICLYLDLTGTGFQEGWKFPR